MEKPKHYDFAGWATRSNIKCSDERTIAEGSFAHQNGTVVPLIWQHDHNNMKAVLGNAYLDCTKPGGVYTYATFNNTPEGQRAKEMVRHGDIRALSIYANQLKQDDKRNVLHGEIREVSLVLAGANSGALIDDIAMHEDGSDYGDQAEIKLDDNLTELIHGDLINQESHEEPTTNTKDVEENLKEETLNLEHKDCEVEKAEPEEMKGSGKTVKQVIDSWDEDDKLVIDFLIGKAVEQAKTEAAPEKKEEPNVKHSKEENPKEDKIMSNVFDANNLTKKDERKVLTHGELLTIVDEVKNHNYNGSLKSAFIAHGFDFSIKPEDDELAHSIHASATEHGTDMGLLFPDHKLVKSPSLYNIDESWAAAVMAGVKHVPYARIKSMYADITGEEARALGYVTGGQKEEEVVEAFSRTTDPTTIYKLQKMDRDNLIDITSFDVITWLKNEMDIKLKEECARAIVYGDGRKSGKNKINEGCIRPIVKDVAAYKTDVTVGYKDDTDSDIALALMDQVLVALDDNHGTGTPDALVKQSIVTKMRLLKDKNGYRIYKNLDEIAGAMGVKRIIPVPNSIAGDNLVVAVNLADYYVGTDKGGQKTMFDDFDLDFNKYEYLIETRFSGALVEPKCAFVFKKGTENRPSSAGAGAGAGAGA